MGMFRNLVLQINHKKYFAMFYTAFKSIIQQQKLVSVSILWLKTIYTIYMSGPHIKYLSHSQLNGQWHSSDSHPMYVSQPKYLDCVPANISKK